MNTRRLFYTKNNIEGPWLLDANDLGEIDAIITEQWNRLEKRRKILLDEAVRREFQDFFQQSGEEKENIPPDVKERIELYRENHPTFSKSFKKFR